MQFGHLSTSSSRTYPQRMLAIHTAILTLLPTFLNSSVELNQILKFLRQDILCLSSLPLPSTSYQSQLPSIFSILVSYMISLKILSMCL